jgi:hypothetical protein
MSETIDVPPIQPAEPVKRRPGRPRKIHKPDPTPKTGSATKFSGQDLVPKNLEERRLAVETRCAYWVGALPDMPGGGTAWVGGVGFHKLTEHVQQDGTVASKTRRTPKFGDVQFLNRDEVQRVAETLPRCIVRVTKTPEEEPIADRRGRLIQIPTEEDIELRKKHKRRIVRYQPAAGDEPLARYLFMVPCVDQKNPQTGHEYPPPLEETGIEWPDYLS